MVGGVGECALCAAGVLLVQRCPCSQGGHPLLPLLCCLWRVGASAGVISAEQPTALIRAETAQHRAMLLVWHWWRAAADRTGLTVQAQLLRPAGSSGEFF